MFRMTICRQLANRKPTPRCRRVLTATIYSPAGGILRVAVFLAERKPALSQVEGDFASSANVVKCKLHAPRHCRHDHYKLAATSKKELPYLQTLAGGPMRRRDFILHAATGLGAWLASKGLSALPFPTPSLPTKYN